jgi:hypothetical protein
MLTPIKIYILNMVPFFLIKNSALQTGHQKEAESSPIWSVFKSET